MKVSDCLHGLEYKWSEKIMRIRVVQSAKVRETDGKPIGLTTTRLDLGTDKIKRRLNLRWKMAYNIGFKKNETFAKTLLALIATGLISLPSTRREAIVM